jgi:hypothetical protein
MESLEQFFKDNQRGYLRDPRRMAYAKLQKNTQGMDREQLEAFITANLFIPHSQYKMALGNLIQFLKKQDQMSKLNEVKQFQKLAGLIKEGWHPDDPASVDMDDMEDEDPEDFDDVSEDADYESESGDTNAMGDIDAMSIDEAGGGFKFKVGDVVNSKVSKGNKFVILMAFPNLEAAYKYDGRSEPTFWEKAILNDEIEPVSEDVADKPWYLTWTRETVGEDLVMCDPEEFLFR